MQSLHVLWDGWVLGGLRAAQAAADGQGVCGAGASTRHYGGGGKQAEWIEFKWGYAKDEDGDTSTHP